MGTVPIALLVRHACTDASHTRLAGRSPDVHLSERGFAELTRLRQELAMIPLDAVYSSPLVRARETAEPIASDHGLLVDVEDALNEVDFGDWTGQTFEALEADDRWKHFNRRRSRAKVPNGERPTDVQRRVVTVLGRLAARHARGVFAVVTHAEIIRSAILWFAGRSLDDFHQFPIETASVTAVAMSSTPHILFTNATPASGLLALNDYLPSPRV